MNNALKIDLNYLIKRTFDLMRDANELNPLMIESMPLPKLQVTSGPSVDNLTLLEGVIRGSAAQGEHHDMILATLFNIISGLHAAIYRAYGANIHGLKIAKESGKLLELYCQTRKDFDLAIVKMEKSA